MTTSASTLISEKDKEVFAQVGEIWENLRGAVLTKSTFKPLDTLSEWLQVLTGDYMYLAPRLGEVSVARSNKEVAVYMRLKANALADEVKFVSAPAEKEARSEVSELKEAERIFESYQNAAEQGILTLKKLIEVQLQDQQREGK